MRSRSRSPRLKSKESGRYERSRSRERLASGADRERDREHKRRNHRREDRGRERDGGRRGGRERHRERSREREIEREPMERARPREKDSEHRHRDKERRQERDRRGSRSHSKERHSRRSGSSSRNNSAVPVGGAVPKFLLERPKITEDDLKGKSEEEQEMLKLMGFAGFDSTCGKHVPGNDASAVNSLQKRKYRQYMNRKGGFNRLLDFVA